EREAGGKDREPKGWRTRPASAQRSFAQAAPPPRPRYARVEIAPPPPRVEVVPPAPSAIHVWVPGFWSYASGCYSWIAGELVVRPRPDVVWVPARWSAADAAWYLEPGRWEATPARSPASAAPVAAPPNVVDAHDIHVEVLRAHVICAHDVHAK